MTHRIRIVSTGGTIASTKNDGDGDGGKTPSESGDSLVDAVPTIGDHATIEVDDVCRVSGFQMGFDDATAVVDAVERASDEGVDGVVVTHGTDTMAETAYLLDSTLEADVPVVCTGAQRSFDQLGTDGPTNLVAAVRAAVHERFREVGGAYLAFNDTVHAARGVVKAHTSALETFESPETGPIAEFTPNGLRFFREPGRYSPQLPGARLDPEIRVDIVTNATGVDGRQVERALEERAEGTPEAGLDGVVVAGTGLGNATAELGGAIEAAIDAGVPVVLTSRCHAGTTAGVYGGGGGAKTLLEAGAISGGDLPSWKARLTLALLLSDGSGIEEIRGTFEGIDSV